MILFGHINRGIFRETANGGTPEAVTRPDSANGEISHRFPQLLPDGKTLIYRNPPRRRPASITLLSETGEQLEHHAFSNRDAVDRFVPEMPEVMLRQFLDQTPTIETVIPLTKTIEGEDIVVGGSGFVNFYDKQLVQFADKYTKKWGGKVEDYDITSDLSGDSDESIPDTIHRLKITDAMREALSKRTLAIPLRRSNAAPT